MSQAKDFCCRSQAGLDFPDYIEDKTHCRNYLKVIRSAEQQDLENLYLPGADTKSSTLPSNLAPSIQNFATELFDRGGNSFAASDHVVGMFEEVEQEREVAFEIETIRQPEKARIYQPLSFPGLNQHTLSFVQTGRFAANAFPRAFEMLLTTTPGAQYGINTASMRSNLFISREFSRTISVQPQSMVTDNFLVSDGCPSTFASVLLNAKHQIPIKRPVNWILWNSEANTGVILIPEEVEAVLPFLQDTANHNTRHTHLLTYAAPVTRKMLHFSHFRYYAYPPLPADWKPPQWLSVEVGIFAGCLYFDFADYLKLTEYLGLSANSNREDNHNAPSKCLLADKPLALLHDWVVLRRKGQDITHTPMGYVCQGKALKPNSSFFLDAEDSCSQKEDEEDLSSGFGDDADFIESDDEDFTPDKSDLGSLSDDLNEPC